MSSVVVFPDWSPNWSYLVSVVVSAADGVVKDSVKVSRSDVRDGCSPSPGPPFPASGPLVVVPLPDPTTKRLISFLTNRGLSNSSRFCAGAAAAKHVAGSSVDSRAKEAAKIIVDLRIIVDTVVLSAKRFISCLDR